VALQTGALEAGAANSQQKDKRVWNFKYCHWKNLRRLLWGFISEKKSLQKDISELTEAAQILWVLVMS